LQEIGDIIHVDASAVILNARRTGGVLFYYIEYLHLADIDRRFRCTQHSPQCYEFLEKLCEIILVAENVGRLNEISTFEVLA
jgi:hypothetical protein